MPQSTLDQSAVKSVCAWLDASDVLLAGSLSAAQRTKYVAAWDLKERYDHLGPNPPRVFLPIDFPFSALRIELDPTRCLRLPHIEETGNFCHGVLPMPEDLVDPVKAAGRVLEQFLSYVHRSAEPEWVEQEFHRESHDYWLRHVAASNAPKGYRTDELLLEIDTEVLEPQRVGALHLGGRTRAIVSSRPGGPKAAAEEIGWSLGTIVHGGALIVQLPQDRKWTPCTWPKSFASLSALADEISRTSGIVSSWYGSRKWSNEAPVFIVLLRGSVGFGWRIIPLGSRASAQPSIQPVKVSRIDRRWSLARDHQTEQLDALTHKRVVIFGCGSVGAPLTELLARAGVGIIEVVDPDLMKPENISRHPLGIQSNGAYKVNEFCQRVKSSVPGVNATPHAITAQSWLATARVPPDLILDCTGDRAVRLATFHARPTAFDSTPIIMAWMEPFGAAAHIVTVASRDKWPVSDPTDTAINIAAWPDEVEVKHPGCGQGFHPYGMADAWEAAAVATRRALALLRKENTGSDIVSLIQSRAYFDRVLPGITFHHPGLIPSNSTSVVVRRTLAEALNGF